MRRFPLVLVLVFAIACGSKSPTSPSTTTPPTTNTPPPAATPTLQSVSLSAALGSLTQAGNTAQVTATGTFSNGTTQNLTAQCTDWASDNTFVLTISNGGLITARNSGQSTITTMCQGVQGRGLVTLNLIPAQLFTRSGTGDQVFSLPSYVSRVRIQASTPSRCQNFAVEVANRLLVNVILGTCSVADARTFDGTYVVTPGGLVEITISTGVNWTFTEVR